MNDEPKDIEIIHKLISIKDKLELIINQTPYEELRLMKTKDFLNLPIGQQTDLSLIESSSNYELPRASKIDNKWDRNIIEIPFWINRNQTLYLNKDKTEMNIRYDDGNLVRIFCTKGLFTRTDFQLFLSSFKFIKKTNESRLYFLFTLTDLLKEIGKEDYKRYFNRVKNYIEKLIRYNVDFGKYKCKKIDGREIEFESMENNRLVNHHFRLSEKENVKNNYYIIFLDEKIANLMLSNLENKYFIYFDKDLFRIKGDIALRIYNDIRLSGKKHYWIDLKNKKYMKDDLFINPSKMSKKYIEEALEELKKLNIYNYEERLNKFFIEAKSKDRVSEEEIENFMMRVFKWADRDCFTPLKDPEENKKYLRKAIKTCGLETIEDNFYRYANKTYSPNPYTFFYEALPKLIKEEKKESITNNQDNEIKESLEPHKTKSEKAEYLNTKDQIIEKIKESDEERIARIREEQKKKLRELREKK